MNDDMERALKIKSLILRAKESNDKKALGKLKEMYIIVLKRIKARKEVIEKLEWFYARRRFPIISVHDWNRYTLKQLMVHLKNVEIRGCRL